MPGKPLSQRRRADAARNDERVLEAAREVFAEHGYRVQMATVAERAGVGLGTLYQRYPSKQALVTAMSTAAMERIITEAETALATGTDAWTAFATFMRNCAEAGAGTMLDLAGFAPPGPGQMQTAERLRDAITAVLTRATQAGVLRPGITPADIYLLFAQLRTGVSDDPQRARQLRARFLAIVLDGLRPAGATHLPGPPAQWEELQQRWTQIRHGHSH